ncbi:hypothetical protein Vretimale_2007 [Volvox reticuliferus]|uniref:Uncharacterized protein n=1 Tax=Volvox reticuliferus TaxID=1737510 RepID=A0A8J4C937_9CHLO|nr:hypothetical protein Vretifemale_4370 [Volvox reticuliferus]GIL96180.1 hypothetical protein Vretimale_2007 [Volvox reticuliferus]
MSGSSWPHFINIWAMDNNLFKYKCQLLQILIILCFTSPSLQQQFALTEALLTSPLVNTTNDQKLNILHNLQIISQAPCQIRLLNASELLYGASQFCRELLGQFPTLNESNIELWLQKSLGFLADHAKGSKSITLPTNQSLIVPSAHLSGLPMVRRSLLAQLVYGWLTSFQRQLPARLEPLLAQLISQMYGIHCSSVIHRGVMQYHHISKSGGTAWNEVARANGCVFPANMGNHVRGFSDECRWLNPKVYGNMTGGKLILWARWGQFRRPALGQSCWSRFFKVAEAGMSYISNEYTLIGGREEGNFLGAHNCPQFVNVVTLRHPRRRLESALRFIQVYIRGYWKRDDPQNGAARYKQRFCNATADLWRALAPAVVDNYIVRSFLGESGFHTPTGLINDTHLEAARDQLLQFDLVLNLEAGREENDWVVQQGLGWPAAWSKANRTLNGSLLYQLFGHECDMRPEVLEELHGSQEYDIRLYRFAWVVNQLDALWLSTSRALGLRPETAPGAMDPGAGQQALRCGLLWQGSNGSTLGRALDSMGLLRKVVQPPPPLPRV